MFFSVAFARRADVREVIERRRDADGVREKGRRAGDAEEEQIVTVRSHHEMTRVRDRHPRVSYQYTGRSFYPLGKPTPSPYPLFSPA